MTEIAGTIPPKYPNLAEEIQKNGVNITAESLMDIFYGKTKNSNLVLTEFQKHNDELFALIPSGEVAQGTYDRYVTARSHVRDYIKQKYKSDDLAFHQLNFEFIKDYELYLKTVRGCNNNTTLKYIANFKKIVLRGIAKDYIPKDPFMLFKGKKTKPNKKPLSKEELLILENKKFSTKRLEVIRDIFVFQCYTGLAYSDVYKLQKTNIIKGLDGELWIRDNRRKSKSEFNVPLLPKALEIMEKYESEPECIVSNKVLPVKSNQKMNEYLKEIAVLCEFSTVLNTHKARRTFGSTVTLANGVPIHVVKDMLGHQSVRQKGNQAFEHIQNDVYGQAMLSLLPLFTDYRFQYNNKKYAEKWTNFILNKMEITIDEEDAGIWEFRNMQNRHCYSNLFQWAGASAALKIGSQYGFEEIANRATIIRDKAASHIEKCYDPVRKVYNHAQDSQNLDASTLQLIMMNYLDPNSEQAKLHLEQLEKELKGEHGLFYRYLHKDDFGKPKSTFLVCAFWYVEALACVGRIEEAQQTFYELLSFGNHLMLFSEDVDDRNGSQWGNFPQAYSHVGLMNAAYRIAIKLDKPTFFENL